MFKFRRKHCLPLLAAVLISATGSLAILASPGLAGAVGRSPTMVQLEPDPAQAEPGQPITVRITGLPAAVIAGQQVACLTLTDGTGRVSEGPMPVSPHWNGAAETRFTLSRSLEPGIYQLQVVTCGWARSAAPGPAGGEPQRQTLGAVPYTIIASTGRFDQIERYPAPNGSWTVVVNQTAGRLDLENAVAEIMPVFPAGSSLASVSWSPDSRTLLVVRPHWLLPPAKTGVESNGPIEIWRVPLADDRVEQPTLLFRSSAGDGGPQQIVFGKWSPDGQKVLFWRGMLSASILADGLGPYVLDIATGQAAQPAEWALVNPDYHSWAPDSSALVITAGGYRSAQVNKWLNLFEVASGRVTTVISQAEQIPGIVAWSPSGRLIAYAAVPAAKTGPEWVDLMTLANPAIAGRRIYLLDPATGRSRRLNGVEAFQDAPAWSRDGQTLYYVQQNEQTMALMAADPATGQASLVEGSVRPAPQAVGYYGQSDWRDILAYRPDAPRAEVPALAELYITPGAGYTLRYPAGWYVSDGWPGQTGWQARPTFSSYPLELSSPPDLGPFSGQALITVQVKERGKDEDLASILAEALAAPGPDQVLGQDRRLTAYDQRELTLAGQPALRLETMGDFSTVNHVQILLGPNQALILRGRGDSRIFEAVAGSLTLADEFSEKEAPSFPERPAILDVFPLEVGTSWVYSVTVETGTPDQLVQWSGLVTETVTSLESREESIVARVELKGCPYPGQQAIEPRDEVYHYIAFDSRLYRWRDTTVPADLIVQKGQGYEGAQILTWPLEVGQEWGSPEFLARGDGMYAYHVDAREAIQTPAGSFDDCYVLAFRTNPDDTTEWFCPGVGWVGNMYRHHGSIHNETWLLQSWSQKK